MSKAMFALAGLAALAAGAPARAQDWSQSEYRMRYGDPVRVGLWDLAQSPEMYEGRAIETKGRLEPSLDGLRSSAFVLRDGTAAVELAPVGELASSIQLEAPNLLGAEVEVVGVFARFALQRGSAGVVSLLGRITFWELTNLDDRRDADRRRPVETVALEALVSRPQRRDGQRVRVVGQFRGHNLFGDLPTRSRSRSGDWVLKDDVYAVWVTGRKSKGDGFNLDARLKRDTGKWLAVTGRVATRGGVVYVAAESVELTTAPSPTAQAAPPPPPPERPKVPPVIVFSLPLDGEAEIGADQRFAVQFSKDMDEKSFAGRVLLRYAGPVQPGDRAFVTSLAYDGGRRALTVDPGDRLRGGRPIELILLDGIKDLDGLPLQPRDPENRITGAADVLRWFATDPTATTGPTATPR